jgi:putative flippase GtrA
VRENVRILRFVTVGTLNALIIAVVVWLMGYLRFGYITANVVAYTIAQIHNFLWCKYWIFPKGDEAKFGLWKQVVLFVMVFAAAYGAQFLFLILMVEVFGMSEFPAQFLGLFVYGAMNYILNEKATFK